MGYRSDVSIVMKRDLFSKVLKSAPEATKDLIQCADRFSSKDDYILLMWSGIKWYRYSDSSVDKFWNALQNNLSDEGEDYYFIELGQSTDHIEESGGLWENPWNTSVVREIYASNVGKDIDLSAFM